MTRRTAAEFIRTALNRETRAFLQYTGGTTGEFEGAVSTHGNVLANVLIFAAWMKPAFRASGEVSLIALPLYHDIPALVKDFTKRDLLRDPDQKPCIALVECAIKCTAPKMQAPTHAARKTATKGSATMLMFAKSASCDARLRTPKKADRTIRTRRRISMMPLQLIDVDNDRRIHELETAADPRKNM